MHKARTKKQELRRRILTFTIAPTIVIIGVTLLVLYIIGYRFNTTDNTLDQGGLIQLISQPSGATVEVDGMQLKRTTGTRLDAMSGTHTVTMSKAGYRPWQKTVSVEPGAVLWLNYARLVPETIQTTQKMAFNSVDQAVPVYEKDSILVIEDDRRPVITIADLSSEDDVERVTLPDGLSRATPASSYSIDSIDGLGRYVVLKATGSETNWFFVDLTNASRSLNLSSIVGAPILDVRFYGDDARKLYVLSNDTVRMIEVDNQMMSAPLISKVDSIAVSPKGVLSYVTKYDETSSRRMVGYFTAGASKPRVIRRIHDNGNQLVDFRIDSYHDDRYGAVRIGNNLEIIGLPSESSDAPDDPRTTNVSTITLSEGSEYLSFSPGGRFVLSQESSTFTTYDLELSKVTTASLRGDTPVDRQIQWLDQHHVWSDRGGKLTMYEFDGANAQVIGTASSGNAALLSKNGKQLWYLDKVGNKTVVKSAQLVQ